MRNHPVPARAAPGRYSRPLAVFLLLLWTWIDRPALAAPPPSDPTVEELVAALESPDSGLRGKSLTALVQEKKDARSARFAAAALKDANWYNRMNAARLLGELRDPDAVEPLGAALRDDKWNVREVAAEALGRIGGPRSVEVLLAALKSPFPDVRVRVSNILTLVKFPDALPLFQKALSDESPSVRITAALAIQNTDPNETGPLTALLEDPDPRLREKAALLLGLSKPAP